MHRAFPLIHTPTSRIVGDHIWEGGPPLVVDEVFEIHLQSKALTESKDFSHD